MHAQRTCRTQSASTLQAFSTRMDTVRIGGGTSKGCGMRVTKVVASCAATCARSQHTCDKGGGGVVREKLLQSFHAAISTCLHR